MIWSINSKQNTILIKSGTLNNFFMKSSLKIKCVLTLQEFQIFVFENIST